MPVNKKQFTPFFWSYSLSCDTESSQDNSLLPALKSGIYTYRLLSATADRGWTLWETMHIYERAVIIHIKKSSELKH